MAKKQYKKKPEVYHAIQYDGTNNAEMIAFCPHCIYDDRLLFMGVVVEPTMWIMSDNAEVFMMKTNEQFSAYFDLAV